MKAFVQNHLMQIRYTVAAMIMLLFGASPAWAAEGDPTMTSYLGQVAEVFTWILKEITELITFIIGNPFLAVGLVLFMCGAVISFFIRIKNA